MSAAGPVKRRGRPQAVVYSVDEVSALCEVPVAVLRRHLAMPGAPFFPGAFERAGEWWIPERGLRVFMTRQVEPHFSLQEVAALLGLSYTTIYKRHVVVPAGMPMAVASNKIGARLFFGEEIRVPQCEVVRVSRGQSTKLSA